MDMDSSNQMADADQRKLVRIDLPMSISSALSLKYTKRITSVMSGTAAIQSILRLSQFKRIESAEVNGSPIVKLGIHSMKKTLAMLSLASASAELVTGAGRKTFILRIQAHRNAIDIRHYEDAPELQLSDPLVVCLPMQSAYTGRRATLWISTLLAWQ